MYNDGCECTVCDVILVCCWFIADMANRFGLEVDKLAENIQDNYQRHDVDQDPANPLELAQEFINKFVKKLAKSQ